MYLPDINVWLALAFAAHVHHRSARRWFDALPENRRCLFCRFTQHGFLRLANNPKAFPQIAVTQVEAWKLYDVFASNPRTEFAAEPPMLETIWRQFTLLNADLAGAVFADLDGPGFRRGWFRKGGLASCGLGRAGAGRGAGGGRDGDWLV